MDRNGFLQSRAAETDPWVLLLLAQVLLISSTPFTCTRRDVTYTDERRQTLCVPRVVDIFPFSAFVEVSGLKCGVRTYQGRNLGCYRLLCPRHAFPGLILGWFFEP